VTPPGKDGASAICTVVCAVQNPVPFTTAGMVWFHRPRRRWRHQIYLLSVGATPRWVET
jgi:hypothetical protein